MLLDALVTARDLGGLGESAAVLIHRSLGDLVRPGPAWPVELARLQSQVPAQP